MNRLPFVSSPPSLAMASVSSTGQRTGLTLAPMWSSQAVAKRSTISSSSRQGPHLNFKAVPGTGPEQGYTESVCNLPHARHSRDAWREYLRNPGDVVIGAVQDASCLGASYEVVLNQVHALEKAGIRDRVRVSFITPEPFVGHFGLGGIEGSEEAITKLLTKKGVEIHTNVAVESISKDRIRLSSGKELSYKFSMLIPPFLGVDGIRNSPGLGDEKGFIPVDEYYRHKQIDNVYAAGVAVALAPPAPTPIPTGAPKTAYMSEVMARTAAHNIVSRIRKRQPTAHADSRHSGHMPDGC